MTQLLTCELCHAKSADVAMRLAWYRGEKEPVQAIDRCRDTAACRDRLEARGDRWPLLERGERFEVPA